jgi:hypothetical protein
VLVLCPRNTCAVPWGPRRGEALLRPYIPRGFGGESARESFPCDAVSAKSAASTPIGFPTLFWESALVYTPAIS